MKHKNKDLGADFGIEMVDFEPERAVFGPPERSEYMTERAV